MLEALPFPGPGALLETANALSVSAASAQRHRQGVYEPEIAFLTGPEAGSPRSRSRQTSDACLDFSLSSPCGWSDPHDIPDPSLRLELQRDTEERVSYFIAPSPKHLFHHCHPKKNLLRRVCFSLPSYFPSVCRVQTPCNFSSVSAFLKIFIRCIRP